MSSSTRSRSSPSRRDAGARSCSRSPVAEIGIEGLTKVYPDGTLAVESLDLAVGDGEFVVFVGPSGCGKTSVLRMVAGLEEITGGVVSIGGRVVNDLLPKERDIAMVFQNYALYPHMTVFDNMAFGLRQRHLPKAEIGRRVNDAARTLGLDETLAKKPRTLSGGQRQRVAMGRAIVREPQAFLMDEPLSNLDAKLRVEMRAEILRLQRDLAGGAPAGASLRIVTDIREDMGSEVYVHFALGVPPVHRSEVAEARAPEEEAQARVAARNSSPFVARLGRETSAREDAPLELAVNVDRLYVFDVETGDGVYDG